MFSLLAAGCAAAGLLILVDGRPEIRLPVGGALLAAAVALGLCTAWLRNVFVWRAEEGVLLGEWSASGQRVVLPLAGPVQLERRRVKHPDHDLWWEVDVALVDSPRLGRVYLWESLPGQRSSESDRWRGLELQPDASPGVPRLREADGTWRLVPGWDWLGRSTLVAGMAVLVWPLAYFASQPQTRGLGSACLALATMALAYFLLRTFATTEVEARPGLVAYRRCVAGVPISEWTGFREPVLLDLTRYPRVEWRLLTGEPMLVVRGGPRGVTPTDALQLTAAIRQALGPAPR
ncbi:hypothetical protein NR798_38850 [Archangium gephyra]|uniref:hypothetical protein n=1 Tax=Archangium gephyra TaxID=48 RepID=UPI0035D4E9B3